ncbi:MAG: hypothetical protein AAFS10_22820, partial [Myxococcota bacterium]
THASSPLSPFDRPMLATLTFDGYDHMPPWLMLNQGFLGELLWRRGSQLDQTQQFLQRLATVHPDQPCHIGVYGHEIAREGFDLENDALLNLSTSFGMRRSHKTYLRLNLNRRYTHVDHLRPGHELLPLYP